MERETRPLDVEHSLSIKQNQASKYTRDQQSIVTAFHMFNHSKIDKQAQTIPCFFRSSFVLYGLPCMVSRRSWYRDSR